MSEFARYLEQKLCDMYIEEHERRHKVDQSLSYPTSILVILGGLILYYTRLFPSLKPGAFTAVLYALSGLMAIGFLLTAYFLVRAYHNYEYGYIAGPEELHEYGLELKTYYEQTDPDAADELAADHLREYLASEYGKYRDINMENNDRKSRYLHFAKATLVISLVIAVVSLYPGFRIQNSVAEVQRVEIVNAKMGDVNVVIRAPKTNKNTSDGDKSPAYKAGSAKAAERKATKAGRR